MNRNEAEITTLRLQENCEFKMHCGTFIGSREYQQDRMFAYDGAKIKLAAVCDGMGGMECGEKASQLAVDMLAASVDEFENADNIKNVMYKKALEINKAVAGFRDKSGKVIESGTTIVMVVVEGDKMYTLSAGDSRIYLMRDDELMQITKDHNYRLRLDSRLEAGLIDEELYRAEESKAEALISFLGIGEEIIIDILNEPVELRHSDRVILCSDGLYKALDNEKIAETIRNNQMDMGNLPDKLIENALYNSPLGMDNITIIAAVYE